MNMAIVKYEIDFSQFQFNEKGYYKFLISEVNSSNTELFPIESDKEWKIIDTILKELQEEVKGEANE